MHAGERTALPSCPGTLPPFSYIRETCFILSDETLSPPLALCLSADRAASAAPHSGVSPRPRRQPRRWVDACAAGRIYRYAGADPIGAGRGAIGADGARECLSPAAARRGSGVYRRMGRRAGKVTRAGESGQRKVHRSVRSLSGGGGAGASGDERWPLYGNQLETRS